jgi:hypothetical protein
LWPFASTSLAQEIVAGENKMFARADSREFAHRQLVRRNILGRRKPIVEQPARKNENLDLLHSHPVVCR